MRRLTGTAGALALAALALPLSAPTFANPFAQNPAGSDRAGQERRVDTPPPGSNPAPGTRLRAGQTNLPAPATGAAAAPMVVGSHQIDRYDAIKKLQEATEKNSKSLADWIILGEISHEVAMNAPADQAGKYFKMSRDAFEKALALDPNNAGLKAAVQFAKDQQANVDQFEKSRDAVTDTFLDARRRDLVATGNTPSVQVFAPPLPSRTLPGPAPSGTTTTTTTSIAPAARPAAPVDRSAPAITPAPPNAPSTDSANYGTQQNYSLPAGASPYGYVGPFYQPFATPNGAPYTYQQYSSAYYPPGLYNNPAAPPMTLQRYSTSVVPNTLERQILNRAATRPVR